MDMRRLCLHCGAEVADAKRLGTEFCNRACQNAAYWSFFRADTLASKAGRSCHQCGGPIPDKMRAGAIYCSKACNNAAHGQRRKG